MKKVQTYLLNSDGRTGLFNLRLSDTSRYEIHLVHSSIPAKDQQVVFSPAPKGVRRIILGTNICEASITLPRVTVVIDTCSVKRKVRDSRQSKCRYVRADPEARRNSTPTDSCPPWSLLTAALPTWTNELVSQVCCIHQHVLTHHNG